MEIQLNGLISEPGVVLNSCDNVFVHSSVDGSNNLAGIVSDGMLA